MRRAWGPIPLLAGLLGLYLTAPFIAGIVRLSAADWHGAAWGTIERAGGVSLASASIATLLVALGGIPLGYMLARTARRGVAAWVGFAVQLPLALPPLASGILLLFLVGGVRGLTDSLAGIVLAQTFVAAPFAIIASRSAFAAVDPDLEDVAATLGHRPWAVFRRVSLAVAARPIWAGLLLAWLRAFGEFGATALVAYHPYSLPILTYVSFGGEGLPATLPILLPTLAIALVVLGVSQAALAPRRTRVRPVVPLGALPLASARAPTEGPALRVEVRRALEGFSLDVAWRTNARRLAILGPSGSGKSLTLRAVAGLDRDGSEIVVLDGVALDGRPPEARQVGLVPQSYGLMPHLRTQAQIGFAADASATLAARWTERLGLLELGGRLPSELSLGQRQRVALARALSRPSLRLLLLDEPFSALDTALRERLRLELRALQAELDVTTVLVTHDPAEALMLADELLLLDGGRVIQAGAADAVWARPANETAARLLGAAGGASGVARGDGMIDIGSGLCLPVGDAPVLPGPVSWAVRPWQVRVGRAGEGLPATLLHVGQVRAGQRVLSLRVGGATLEAAVAPGGVPDGEICVSIDPRSVQVWARSA